VGDRLAVLYHSSGHAALVSSVTLEHVGIDPLRGGSGTPDVGRFPDGRPSGILYDEAMKPLGPIVAAAGAVGRDDLERTIFGLSSFGLTTVASMGSSSGEVSALRELGSMSRWCVSVRVYVRSSERRGLTPERAPGPGAQCAVVGVKEFLDGAFGTRTAWLSEPYEDDPAGSGISVTDDRGLVPMLEEISRTGLAPALHAIGDRAVARGIRLLEPTIGPGHPPSRIEHAALTPPELLPQLERVRPTLVVQPGFVWSDGWLVHRLGPVRARWAYALRTLLVRGIPLAGSSDAPFDPVNPWRGIRAAVHRRGDDGRSANPLTDEALAPEEALAMYTLGGAAALGEPDRGRLESGAVADLAVLSTPDLARALAGPENPVSETWVAGRRVVPLAGGGGG
jgi:hypothetical protein